MRTCREVVEPLRAILIRVPPTGVAGVCRVCHGAPNRGHAVCESCSLTRRHVSKPIELVVPISFSTRPSQLHQVLTDYKSSPYPDVRRELSQQVICLLAHFLGTHASCIRGIAGRSWTAVTVVPSSIDRAGPHPLETAADRVGWKVVATLCRGEGMLGSRNASDDGFRTIGIVDGMSLLLVDDTFTSGARLQSAASALQLAGANVVAAVVVARFMDPASRETTRTLLERARARRFDFRRCCLETEDEWPRLPG